MAFENKQPMSKLDLNWQQSDYISPLVCAENDDLDKDASGLKIAWFQSEAVFKPSEDEEKERMLAMRYQFENKIINKYGLPYGMQMPKELKKLIQEREAKQKKSKWDRKRQRLVDRQIEKDMNRERQKEKQQPYTSSALYNESDLDFLESLTNTNSSALHISKTLSNFPKKDNE